MNEEARQPHHHHELNVMVAVVTSMTSSVGFSVNKSADDSSVIAKARRCRRLTHFTRLDHRQHLAPVAIDLLFDLLALCLKEGTRPENLHRVTGQTTCEQLIFAHELETL